MGLKLSHAFINVADLDAVVPFYTDLLGFRITDRGRVSAGFEAVFMSQDPDNHHQIALAQTLESAPDGSSGGGRNLGHVAFRMESLDDLRGLKRRLRSADIPIARELSHGNAWSLYFADPEGNGVECFVDTPFHVSQPQGKPTDIDLGDDDLLDKTRSDFCSEPEFGSYQQWQRRFRSQLESESDR